MPGRFEVVMTLGPASESRAVRARLLASADRFRLNASHMEATALARCLDELEELFRAEGRRLPVVVDLRGSKMRIGEVPEVSSLPPSVRLVLSDAPSSEVGVVPVPEPELFEQVVAGQVLTLNDARVTLRVEDVRDGEIRARVLVDGPLSSRKGINRPGRPLSLARLRPSDRAAVEATRDRDFVQFALSFVHDGREADLLRAHTDRPVIGKLELPEALSHLEALERAHEELWLCRGDLGAQAGAAALGGIQEEFARALPRRRVPCLLAGQVLEHMTGFPQPTRSEVVHLHDVVRAGWAGVVLSDETAVGRHPLRVAEVIDELVPGRGTARAGDEERG